MKPYTLSEPFETRCYGHDVAVFAYDADSGLFVYAYTWLNTLLQTGAATAHHFDPPPPIPAAARKPKVGEVWLTKGGYKALLTAYNPALKYWDTFCPSEESNLRVEPARLVRPATQEEAEPFRDLLNGLQAALGEGK